MSSEIRQKRVVAIDLLRGIAIFAMIMAHVETYWLEWESYWSIGIKFLIIQIMGTSNFTFVAGIGFAFSFQNNLKKSTSRSLTIKKSLSRTIIMIILSL
ncbi:MAG: heparan-alpha-glucosaminide N-acetyltransferase domain-containing protein, partial [Promethearchaeota archaeon]